MKKITSIVILIVVSLSTIAQQQHKSLLNHMAVSNDVNKASVITSSFKPEKELYSKWDTIGNIWVPQDSTIYTYNSAGNPIQSLTYGIAQNYMSRTTYTYNVNQKETDMLGQYLNGLSFQDSYKKTTTYNVNNSILTYTSQSWNNTSGAWVNDNNTMYSYNVNNQNTGRIDQTWKTTTSTWENESKEDYTLNALGQPTIATISTWTLNAWQQGVKIVNITWYEWNTTVNDSKLLSYEMQEWNGTSWQNVEKTTATYDAQGNITQYLTDTWNGTAYVFKQQDANSYTYDVNNNMTQNIYQFWNPVTSSVRNTFKYDYGRFVSTTIGVNELATPESVSIYPNPVKNSVTIHSLRAATISVCNMLGESVYSQLIPQGKSTIDMSNQPSGVYFITTENKTIKFIKE